MDEKKGNKWFAMLMTVCALMVITLIVVIVIGMSSVKKQVDNASKTADQAFTKTGEGGVPVEEVEEALEEKMNSEVQEFYETVENEMDKLEEELTGTRDGK